MIRERVLAAINQLCRLRGMELRACPTVELDPSMDAALRRAAILMPDIGTIIDVGAAAGTWTRRALPHFPGARCLLIEPLQERERELENVRAAFPNAEVVLAAAGEKAGEATLNISDDLDSSGIYGMKNARSRTVPVVAIDDEVRRRGLPAPIFLKLDTHGFEEPILRGAHDTLHQTALIMVEVYNFVLCPGCLRFPALCTWLETLGFLPTDIIEPLRRKRDGILWQFDCVFARRDHPAFLSSSYR